MISKATQQLLRRYAAEYEPAAFIEGDPSWFMHQVSGSENQEAMAFIASCLSYGSRKQFMPKIQWLLERAEGKVDEWVRSGAFADDLPAGDSRCFYRLYTVGQMHRLLQAYRRVMLEYGSLGEYVSSNACDGLAAIEVICRVFGQEGASGIVPQDAQSACKRVCMFLRWMVRDSSPVDLGIWSSFIDKRTLVMPLDTHVVQQATRLGLLQSATASMSAARRLTAALAEVFPDDPLKGDFALFGYGVNHAHA